MMGTRAGRVAVLKQGRCVPGCDGATAAIPGTVPLILYHPMRKRAEPLGCRSANFPLGPAGSGKASNPRGLTNFLSVALALEMFIRYF